MGFLDAISNALGRAYNSQTNHTIEPAEFDEHSLIVQGVDENGDEWYGELTNGSIIVVPNSTFAIILDHDSIEGYIGEPGKYIYEDGACSLFNGDGPNMSVTNRVHLRIQFNGKEVEQKRIIYVNLKDIRGIMFGTYTPIVFRDPLYPSDLEVTVCGSFSIRIDDPVVFFTEFVPVSIARLSVDDKKLKAELVSIVLQAISKTINILSGKHSIRDLSSGTSAIRDAIMNDDEQVLYWKQNYGFSLTNLVIESISYSDETRKMMNSVYESQLQRENIQQTINAKQRAAMSFEDQVEAVMKLEKLRQMGILTDSEFQKKKREILGL